MSISMFFMCYFKPFQVPLGWQSLSSALTFGGSILYQESNYVFNANINGINPVSWEAASQRSVEEELYTSIEVSYLS